MTKLFIPLGQITTPGQPKDRNFMLMPTLVFPVFDDAGALIGWNVAQGDGNGNFTIPQGGVDKTVAATTDLYTDTEIVADVRYFKSRTVRVANTGAEPAKFKIEAAVADGVYDVELQGETVVAPGDTFIFYDNVNHFENFKVSVKSSNVGDATSVRVNVRGLGA